MRRGDFVWGLIICGITSILVIPSTHAVFIGLTNTHPYIMGFVKFAILATMGELLGIRIVTGYWRKTQGMIAKAAIWGVVGILITLMFYVNAEGIAASVKAHRMIGASGILGVILNGFIVSVLTNLTFAPAFMSAHRICDTYIDLQAEGKPAALSQIIDAIDWKDFIKFVVGKTILYFWIPAHTITFSLPAEYRVIVAAYLSIALGIILSYARRRNTNHQSV